jgi:F-type H+-transporting ATPase subunit b
MDATLQQLGGLLLKTVPTIVLLLIVHFYLKWMFFRPLEQVLDKRKQSTDGARQNAEVLLAKASTAAADIEAELRKAREEIYHEQEEVRRRWITEQSAHLEEARRASRELIYQARQQLEADTAAAKRELAASAGVLASEIERVLLARKTA